MTVDCCLFEDTHLIHGSRSNCTICFPKLIIFFRGGQNNIYCVTQENKIDSRLWDHRPAVTTSKLILCKKQIQQSSWYECL